MSLNILIVEKETSLRNRLTQCALNEGYEVKSVAAAEEALALFSVKPFDIVVVDLALPKMSGLELLSHLNRLHPEIFTIALIEPGDVQLAVEAMKNGARDVLEKMVSLEAFVTLLRVGSERITHHTFSAPTNSAPIIAESAPMKKLLRQISIIARYNSTVLITGETGAGKELVARSVHEQSERRKRPFVALNCAAVPEQLLEDELFGHVKGAFTGAQNAREGRFEQADGGTLFLDEIGDMSLPLQSKLLRVLQEREFEKLGSSRTIKVDVRILAATSADLERRMAEGSFRPDLFYRLNVMHVRLPPLRERVADIRPLAQSFLSRFCASVGLAPKKVSEDVWQVLEAYRWPGNVRQLQNAMERAAILSGDAATLTIEDLPEEVRAGAALVVPQNSSALSLANGEIPDEGLNFDAVVTNIERELLLGALNKTGGNKMRAAKLLNMKRTTFHESLKRLQIDAEEDAREAKVADA
jgi:DNA-binding NtrC family response regulator